MKDTYEFMKGTYEPTKGIIKLKNENYKHTKREAVTYSFIGGQ